MVSTHNTARFLEPAMTGVNGSSFEAPIIVVPIGGPMLQLGPGSFEPGLPPELPKAQPKVPSPADSSVTSRPNEPCAPRPKNPPNRPPNGSTHRVSIPKQDPPRNSLSHLVRHQRDDHVNDFAGQAKGHRDGDFAIPGIRRALKLIEELVIHYGPSGGLGVPPPAKPPNSPPPRASRPLSNRAAKVVTVHLVPGVRVCLGLKPEPSCRSER